MWKGYLKVSLITVPVRMYTATERTPLRFHLLHGACHTRIRQQNYCPTCDEVVPYEELVRGYEYGKDTYVVLTEEDFERARKEATDTIEVFQFVDRSRIAPVYYTDAHYLAPDGRVAVEAFALFLRAMEEEGAAALARVVLRNRENLLAIQPHGGTLAAYTLHHAEEVRSPADIEGIGAVGEADLEEGSLRMAHTVIDNLRGTFDIEAYADEYRQTLEEIIEAKAQGEEIRVEPSAEPEKVVNLLDALKESVERTGGAPKKEMARAGRKRTRRGGKRKAGEG